MVHSASCSGNFGREFFGAFEIGLVDLGLKRLGGLHQVLAERLGGDGACIARFLLLNIMKKEK